MVNGTEAPQIVGETTQQINCGAAVNLTPEVFEHGIMFLYPGLPAFKLFFTLEAGGKLNHRFEICRPLFPEVKRFSVNVIPGAAINAAEEEALKSALVLP